MERYPLSVLMIGPTAYRVGDESHATYAIWRELARGFARLAVMARALGRGGRWTGDGVEVRLFRGFRKRELEFAVTQLALVPAGVRWRPDVIVSQGVALGGFAALLIARLCGAGTLIEVHNDDFSGKARPFTRRWLLQRAGLAVLRRATLIRVLSEEMGERLVELMGEGVRPRLRVLPPRVDLGRFGPVTDEPAEDGRFHLALIGSLCERKGQLRLIDDLCEAGAGVTLHLVGSGPDRALIEERVAALPGDGLRVRIHGQVDHDGVARILEGCDTLVCYSTSEGTPRVLMEAMAMGKAPITTDVGFCADVLADGREGFVLRRDDPAAHLRALLPSLVADRARLAAMGLAARDRAERDYDAAKVYPRYRALIAEAAR